MLDEGRRRRRTDERGEAASGEQGDATVDIRNLSGCGYSGQFDHDQAAQAHRAISRAIDGANRDQRGWRSDKDRPGQSAATDSVGMPCMRTGSPRREIGHRVSDEDEMGYDLHRRR